MQDVVENNILRFWSEKMVDHAHGGFYGRMDEHGVLYPEAEKVLFSMLASSGLSLQPTGY